MNVKAPWEQTPARGEVRHGRTSDVLVEEHRSRFGQGRKRGALYALVEVSGPAGSHERVVRGLLEAVRDTYAIWRGSLTAGLQQAIHAANSWLIAENQDSLPGERYTAGMTCAVLADTDLFVAQAGPAAAFVIHEGQVARFPETSPWLEDLPAGEPDTVPLGEHRDLVGSLFHTPVNHGDRALLVESWLARRLTAPTWRRVLQSPSVDEAKDALLAAAGEAELSAVVIGVGEEVAAVKPGRPAILHGAAERPEAAPPGAVRSGADAWVQPEAPLPSPGAVWSRLLPPLRKAGSALTAVIASLAAGLLTLLRRTIPGRAMSAPGQGRVASRVTAPGPARRAQSRPATPRRNPGLQRLMLAVAIAIPLIVGAAVLATYIRRAQAEKAELAALWQKADASWKVAQQAQDTATIRTHLADAAQAVEQLLQRQPENEDAAALQTQIEAWLDEINQVRRINRIDELKAYPAGANLSRVVVEGVHVFVMDRNGGKVYHHQLDTYQQALEASTADTVLVSKGQQVGGVLVSDLVDMAWVPVGEGREKANLVILESGGGLLEYDPSTGEVVELRVDASVTWQFPRLVGSFYGRFYVLDTAANKIWRYRPTVDGYSSPPDDWLQAEVDLLGAIDMAIGDSIFLLYSDGNIRKLTTGEPDRFDVSDWDAPPSRPGGIFARPPDKAQWVYVADRGGSRIVQCSPEGLFKRQFRLTDSAAGESDPLAGVTSLFVDEIGGRAYFLSGQKLYMLFLPE